MDSSKLVLTHTVLSILVLRYKIEHVLKRHVQVCILALKIGNAVCVMQMYSKYLPLLTPLMVLQPSHPTNIIL